MSQQEDRLEVIDKNGWRKIYPLQKAIIHIGSDPRSDIVLEGGRGSGVNSRHAQLIVAANHRSGYQLVNLADEAIALGSAGERTLAPHAVMPVTDGQSFKLGEFTLIFHTGPGGVSAGPDASVGSVAVTPSSVADRTRNIGLSLALPQTLPPYQSVDALVKVQNLGEQKGVQFELEILGLEAEYYDIEPGPLLPPGAEKAILLRLHHRGAKPLAGDLEVTVRATAPRAYLGEEATISRTIQVLPAYRHRLRLLSPGDAALVPHAEADFLTPKAKSGPLPRLPQQPAMPQPTEPRPQEQELWTAATASTAPTAASELRLKAKTPPAGSQASTPPEAGSMAADLWNAPSGIVPPAQRPVTSQAEATPQALDLWGAPADVPPREKRERLPSKPIAVEADVPSRTRERESTGTYLNLAGMPKTSEGKTTATPPLSETGPSAQTTGPVVAPVAPAAEQLPGRPTQEIAPALEASSSPAQGLPSDHSPADTAPSTVQPELEQLSSPLPAGAPASPAQPEAVPPPIARPPAEPEQPPLGAPATVEPAAVTAEPPLKKLESSLKQWWSHFGQRLPFYRRKPAETPSETDQAPEAKPEPSVSFASGLTPESAAGAPAQVTGEPMPPVSAPVVEPEVEHLREEGAEPDATIEYAEVHGPAGSLQQRLSSAEQPIEAAPSESTAAEVQTPLIETTLSGERMTVPPTPELETTSLPAVGASEAKPQEVETEIKAPPAEEPSQIYSPAIKKTAATDEADWWFSTEEVQPSEPQPVVETQAKTEARAETPAAVASQTEPAETKTPPISPSQQAVDWWGEEIEAAPPPKTTEKQVIKLKASSTQGREPSSEIELPPEVADWWSAEAESEKSAAKHRAKSRSGDR